MFWSTSICRLCSQSSITMYYVFEDNIEAKLKQYLKLNVYKEDCKPKQVCNCCYLKLEEFVDFLDMCYDSNNKFECSLYNQRKSALVEDDWSREVHEFNEESHVNISECGQNLFPLLKKESTLELGPLNVQHSSNIVQVGLNFNAKSDQNQSSVTVVRHSSEYITGTSDYESVSQFCSKPNFAPEPANVKADSLVRSACIYSETDRQIGSSSLCREGSVSDCVEIEGSIIKTVEIAQKTTTINDDLSEESKAKLKAKNRNESGKKFGCNYCSKYFVRKDNLKAHLAVHTNVRPFKCDICPKSFALKWDLTFHKRIHTDLHQCAVCSKNFRCKSKLDRHLRTHTNDKPFACNSPGCSKKFSDKRNLISHETTHSDERNFTCEVCEKKFKTKKQLTQHRAVHSTDATFKCNVCSKSYKFNTNLLLHMKKHDGYFCKFCKQDFQKVSHLLKHRKECKLTRNYENHNIN